LPALLLLHEIPSCTSLGDSVHQCFHSSILRNVGVHFFQPTSDDSGLIEEEFKLDLDRWEELAEDIEAWLAGLHYSMRREIVEWMIDAPTRTGVPDRSRSPVNRRSTFHLVDSPLLYPE
jgi:hypothetical protein